MNKLICNNIRPHEILKDSLIVIENRIKQIIDTFSSLNIEEELLKQKFNPSKTAQTALNFIGNCMSTSINDTLIENLFKLIYILLGENELQENIINDLFNNLFNKYGVKSFSIYYTFIFRIFILSFYTSSNHTWFSFTTNI